MVAKERQNAKDSSKVEVGEIDTRAPFQSVKAAVSLFGEGAFSGERPAIRKAKAHSAEKVLAKESQLHLVEKEVNRLKDQLKNAETTKYGALGELEKAKRTVEELSQKLRNVTESKDAATKATEDAKNQVKKIEETKTGNTPGSDDTRKQDLESATEQYMTVFTELDAAKQELCKIRQECDASLAAKLAAFNQSAEAEHLAKENAEKVGELSKEISGMQESIGQVKLASMEAQQEQAKLFAEKKVQRQSCKASLESSANKLLELKKEFDPELARSLEKQLADTLNEVGSLQKQVESAKTSDFDSVKMVTLELDGAKESLQKIAEEGNSLRSLVDSLKLDLESVQKEHSEVKDREAETESVAGNLHVKLRKCKSELELATVEESKARSASEEIISTLNQLSSEAESARFEAEEMKNKAGELKRVAEASMIALEEAEKKLSIALAEAEEAKMAEAKALDQIKSLSEKTNAARVSTPEFGAKITISKEEFEALSRKVEESDTLTEMKVAAAMAQVEAVKASENESLQRLEAIQKDFDDMKAATTDALKRAEMAEAAKKALEGELRRWREREQKKAAETASRIMAEIETPMESSTRHKRFQKQHSAPPQKVLEVRKFEKEHSINKKVLLTNFSGIFHRKKNQVEGASPSYLPGERPV